MYSNNVNDSQRIENHNSVNAMQAARAVSVFVGLATPSPGLQKLGCPTLGLCDILILYLSMTCDKF